MGPDVPVCLNEMDSSDGPKDWIVQLPSEWSDERLLEYGRGAPGHIKWRGHPSGNGLAIVVFRGTQEELGECLGQSPGAEWVEQDVPMALVPETEGSARRLAAQAIGDDPDLWGLDRIDASRGRDGSYDSRGMAGRGVHVYVTDTGIRTTHAEFGGRAIPTLEVDSTGVTECGGASDTRCAADNNGHGTHCAGTIGGRTFGVAKEATLHAVKVFPDGGPSSFSFFLEAIDFVLIRGERPAVISASLGGPGALRSVTRSVQRATAAGVTVVVAAGNEGETPEPRACQYTPAGVPEAITVGSITKFSDRRSSFSNVGECVDLFAPGSQILSAGHRSDAAAVTASGTSMACPHVAGAAALVLGQAPGLAAGDVAAFLLARASRGSLTDAGDGSPDRVLFVGFDPSELAPAPPGSEPAPAPPGPRCCVRIGPIAFNVSIPVIDILIPLDIKAAEFLCTETKHFWQFYC